MTVLTRSHFAIVLLACCALVPSASAEKIKIDYDQEADFSRVRRYQWRTHPVLEKRPEMKETYATGIQIVLEAGNELLMKRGFQPADDSPDIYVTFFLVAKDAQNLKTTIDWGPWVGPGYGWYGPPAWTITEVEYYKAGMLVIDIVDAKTSKVVWRAYCGEEIRDMRTRDKNIEKVVRKALERFPPKKK